MLVVLEIIIANLYCIVGVPQMGICIMSGILHIVYTVHSLQSLYSKHSIII